MSYLTGGEYKDGLIPIICRQCGEEICRMMYQGFSTATCHRCAKVNPADEAKPLEVREPEHRPEDMVLNVDAIVESIKEKVSNVVGAVAQTITKVRKKKTAGKIKLQKRMDK